MLQCLKSLGKIDMYVNIYIFTPISSTIVFLWTNVGYLNTVGTF